MANRIFERLFPKPQRQASVLNNIVSGTVIRMSDIRGSSSISDINAQIQTMRALAKDSQINTALSYYATDATTLNSDGQIIWATSEIEELADIINDLFRRWDINSYARDHILELATMGNLYIPTTDLYRDAATSYGHERIALDNNTIPNNDFGIIPSYKIPPEDIVHLWLQGKPMGYAYQSDDDMSQSDVTLYPEASVIHFSLGGLLGQYTLDAKINGDIVPYDIMWAEPLMAKATQPTQTLSLLEDSIILSSLTRIVRFISVDCGNAEDEEVQSILFELKNVIEQQLSVNTNTGDAQSFVNPQSPNNLIYLPKINGNDPISITDLNIADTSDTDSKLLQHFEDKKLSVLGVPKEAMNYSSNEGLGGAGTVLAQRSAIYANSLQRLMTAYTAGWTKAFNTYFEAKGLKGFVDKFDLHMNPIITQQSTINAERRDAALNQASAVVSLMKDLGIEDATTYTEAIVEILSEVFPVTSAAASGWNIDVNEGGDEGEF